MSLKLLQSHGDQGADQVRIHRGLPPEDVLCDVQGQADGLGFHGFDELPVGDSKFNDALVVSMDNSLDHLLAHLLPHAFAFVIALLESLFLDGHHVILR